MEGGGEGGRDPPGSTSGPASCCLLGVGRARARRACVPASDPSRPQRIFGPLPACPCSVCVQCVRAGAKRGLPLCARAQQQQQQADKVFPGALTALSHPATTALTPGCCEGKTPAPPAPRFAQPKLGPPFPRGCLRALEPLMAARAPLVRVTEAAAPPRIACVRLSRGRRSGSD